MKFFDVEGQKLTDAAEEEIEALLDAPPSAQQGAVDRVEIAVDSYLEHVLERFGSDLSGLRIAVDCANGAYAGIAPQAFRTLGAEVVAIGDDPNGSNINDGCGATDLALLQRTVRGGAFDLGVAFDGDGDRMLAVDAAGEVVDGDAIVAVLALHLGVDTVAVTSMTNLGFHGLMEEHGVRVLTTDVGDRYVLEALRREGAILGGEQSGHIIVLRDHVTGDGLAAALLLCQALEGRTLAEAAGRHAALPAGAGERRGAQPRPARVDPRRGRAPQCTARRDGPGPRPSRPGRSPSCSVLAEARNERDAADLCGRIAALVRRELG